MTTEELIKLAEQPQTKQTSQNQLSTTELIKLAQQPQQKLSWGEVGKQAIFNVPSDAINQLKNIVHLVKQPGKTVPESIEATVSGIGRLGMGLIETLIPGEQGHEQVASSVWNQLKEDYGGIENLKQTIANKPVQIMFDASSLLLGGAGAARLAGAKTGISALTKAGKVMGKAGQILEPTNIITAPIRGAAKVIIPKTMPERLYTSALKPIAETPLEARKISQFGLTKELTVRYNTWLKVEDKIRFLKDQVEIIIQKGAGKGDVIDINDLIKNLDDLKNTAAPFESRPKVFIRQVDAMKQDILETHMKRSGGLLSPADVQRIKTRMHKLLENLYGETNASTKAMLNKAYAYDARLTLEKLYPELKTINMTEGELIAFNKHLGKTILVHERGDFVRNIAFMIKAVIDQPYLKSKLAIWLNRAKKGHPLGNPKALEKDLLFQSGRISAMSRENMENLQGESTLQ